MRIFDMRRAFHRGTLGLGVSSLPRGGTRVIRNLL